MAPRRFCKWDDVEFTSSAYHPCCSERCLRLHRAYRAVPDTEGPRVYDYTEYTAYEPSPSTDYDYKKHTSARRPKNESIDPGRQHDLSNKTTPFELELALRSDYHHEPRKKVRWISDTECVLE